MAPAEAYLEGPHAQAEVRGLLSGVRLVLSTYVNVLMMRIVLPDAVLVVPAYKDLESETSSCSSSRLPLASLEESHRIKGTPFAFSCLYTSLERRACSDLFTA